MFVSNKRLSAVSLSLNLRTFYSGIILFLTSEMIKAERSDRCQHFARPLGFALCALWSSV